MRPGNILALALWTALCISLSYAYGTNDVRETVPCTFEARDAVGNTIQMEGYCSYNNPVNKDNRNDFRRT